MPIPRATSVAAVLAAVTIGCRAPTASESSAVASTAPASALAVAITLDHATVAVGDPVQATVVARNTSGAPVRVTGSSGCVAYLEVRDAADQVVARGDFRICTRDLVEHEVATGAALTDRPVWSGAVRPPAQGVAPPGTYAVRGVVQLAGGQEAVSAPAPLSVTAR